VERDYCQNAPRQVYAGFDLLVIVVDRCTAEMMKFVSNNFLAPSQRWKFLDSLSARSLFVQGGPLMASWQQAHWVI